MTDAQATWLPDGRRLHLHHGPIDMIIDVIGPGRQAGLARAVARFKTLLDELVTELARLRSPGGPCPTGDTARAMAQAVAPFAPEFITPMAAVAGAGADTILGAISAGPGIARAYVNNGGDVGFHLGTGQQMQAAIASDPPGQIRISHSDPVRGIATSGWRGRSQSLGIADSVTVLAGSAAQADAAATMIANQVDLPGHASITRTPASLWFADSDLGQRLVTTHVGPLRRSDITRALDAGCAYARHIQSCGLIAGAVLVLRGETRVIGQIPHIQPPETDALHA